MPQPDPSVSDSISFLQDFLNSSERAQQPAQPPASLPASFLHSGSRTTPPASTTLPPPSSSFYVPRRSPPSTISVLSRHSSAPVTPLSGPPLRPRVFSSLRPGRNASGLGFNTAAHTPAGESPSGFAFAKGGESASTSFTGSAGMFRYGSDARRGSAGNGWQSTTVAPPRPLPWSGEGKTSGEQATEQRMGSLWGASRPSTSPYISPPMRSAAGAEERFPWRHSAAASPPTHNGSSLLWGWGNESGGDNAPAASSPSPYHPSPFSSGSRRHVDAPPTDTRRPREAAYEEVTAPLPAERAPSQVTHHQRRVAVPAPAQQDGLRRRPPFPPPAAAAQRRSDTVELTTCHNPDEHAANMRRIAHYLKDYYAREAGEQERTVESLTAEDVAGLAQCFYIDLYRCVRQARSAAGLETSSFVAEDPTENAIGGVAPPPPQREGRYGREHSVGPSASPSLPSPTRGAAPRQGAWIDEETYADGERREGGSLLFTSQRTGLGHATPADSQVGQQVRVSPSKPSGSPARNALLSSSPVEELQSSPAATTLLAPNEQLAYSGGGTHPVQIITARVPAFRSDDAAGEGDGQTPSLLRHRSNSGTSLSAMTDARGHRHESPSYTYRPNANRESAADAASLSALAATPSPPYRHVTPAAQQPFSGGQAGWPHPSSSAAAPRTTPSCTADVSRTTAPTGILRGSSSRHRSRHRTRSGSAPGRPRPHFQDSSTSSGSSSSDNSSGADWEGESATSQRGPAGRPAPAEPSSGVVKRPLKDLMPQLRSRGTLIVKHVHESRPPHLRLFQLLDCVDVFEGKEVLMPHFTWAVAENAGRQEQRPRPRRTKHGVPLATGLSLSQQEMPYETALNLTTLEAVYVGAGRGISEAHMRLFHRRARDGVVLDHRQRPVANGMCAVFVFASRPVAVTFLREDDRQVWVGAMMGVVERNRTLVA